jgi:phenylacetate-CoA ligase
VPFGIYDSIMLTNRVCPCGRPSRLVTAIQGRVEDFLCFTSAAGLPITIHPLKIQEIMERVPVTAWQVVLAGNVLTVLLAGKEPHFNADDLSVSFEAFARRQGLDALAVMVKEVAFIPKTSSGKAPLIRNLNAVHR